jgi:hypothetical protein
MFLFRINKMKIPDDRMSAFLFFRKDLADAFVTADDAHALGPWMRRNDPEKRTFLAAAVSNALASRILTEAETVKRNQALLLDNIGYVLFQSERIPEDFSGSFVAAKSKRETRQLGELIGGVVDDPEFHKFTANLATLATGAANPAFMVGVGVTKLAAGTISKILAAKGDERLDILYMPLDRAEHYLCSEVKKECA